MPVLVFAPALPDTVAGYAGEEMGAAAAGETAGEFACDALTFGVAVCSGCGTTAADVTGAPEAPACPVP